MTAHDVKVSLAKVGIVLGALVALVVLTTAFQGWLSEQYVSRQEHAADMAQIKADLRVLRCAVVKDCR